MVGQKRKKQVGDICKGTPDVEFERDWSFRLGAMLRDEQKIKNYFSSFKGRNFNFFLMLSILHFKGREKKARDIYMILDIEFEREQSIC